MSADKAVHIALYPSDWLAGTRGLTPAETGVYITLVCMMYERQAPLNFDPARLARMCNCPAGTFKKILAVLLDEGKLIELPEGLWQARVEREIVAAKSAIDAASDQGRKAAEARWSKAKTQSDRVENAKVKPQSDKQQRSSHTTEKHNENSDRDMQGQCRSNANQNQNQNQIKIHGGDGNAREPENDGQTLRESILSACGADPITGLTGPNGNPLGNRSDMHTVEKWQTDLGLSPETIVAVIRDTMARKRDGPPGRLTYFTKAMQREAAERTAPRLEPAKHDPDPDKANQRPTYRSGASRAHDNLAAGFARAVSKFQG